MHCDNQVELMEVIPSLHIKTYALPSQKVVRYGICNIMFV